MMAQISKVFAILILFSTAVREIEDLIHSWKVNKDCLYFMNKICIGVVIIRDGCMGVVCNILYCNGNFGFHLAQGSGNFQ